MRTGDSRLATFKRRMHAHHDACAIVATLEGITTAPLSMIEHHIFVFRHCVRSTPLTVNLYEGKGKEPASSYFLEKLPPWNVPDEWCTEKGIKILKRTGAWLAQNYFDNKTSTVRIISDTAQRDVDSALALSEGLRQAGVVVSNIELNPDLFHPTRKGSLCPLVNKSSPAPQVIDRLGRVPPPTSLQDALKLMKSLVHLTPSFSNASSSFDLNVNKMHLKGPVNLVKLFSQMLMYSRASNLTFVPEATNSQISMLVEWIAWQRTVEHSFNSKAAARGAVLMNCVFNLLRVEQKPSVTIIFGHDSSLNSLQTALDIEWSLPFYGAHSPTLPGSGMHLQQVSDGSLNVEVVYPTYFAENGTMNTTGILERQPVLSFESIPALKYHVVEQLAQYDGAIQCFEATQPVDICSSGGDYYWILGLLLVLPMLWFLRYKKRWRSHQQMYTYTAVDLELPELIPPNHSYQ